MRYTDIAIIGGGLAGSTAAAMLGRADIATVLIDPHPVYPPGLRCEKLSGHEQLERFRRTGIAESTLRAATHDGENWIARFGYLLDKRPSQQYGIMYDTLVNAVRAEIPTGVEQIYAKAIAISASAERQKVTLSNGEEISARLVVLANGLNVGLLHKLGIRREVVSTCHSITLGFDVVPSDQAAFAFPALTYFSERPGDLIPYVTMFPIGKRMRANLFCYRQMDDPWLTAMRRAPEATLNKSLPRLRRIAGDFRISGDIKIRPADLYVTSGHLQPGVVMVGDAFETTCPVTGTGTDKLFTDVERLCNRYIPDWLSTDGMALDKIAAFYDDPHKKQCDTWSMAKAYNFRSLSIERSFYWRAQRWARFFAWLGEGLQRRMRHRFNAPPAVRTQSSSSSSSLSSSA
jgi:2-polyprenyl-6-methoxyphenol hydroxylase-like FAD-dependent oxidoreductase